MGMGVAKCRLDKKCMYGITPARGDIADTNIHVHCLYICLSVMTHNPARPQPGPVTGLVNWSRLTQISPANLVMLHAPPVLPPPPPPLPPTGFSQGGGGLNNWW